MEIKLAHPERIKSQELIVRHLEDELKTQREDMTPFEFARKVKHKTRMEEELVRMNNGEMLVSAKDGYVILIHPETHAIEIVKDFSNGYYMAMKHGYVMFDNALYTNDKWFTPRFEMRVSCDLEGCCNCGRLHYEYYDYVLNIKELAEGLEGKDEEASLMIINPGEAEIRNTFWKRVKRFFSK